MGCTFSKKKEKPSTGSSGRPKSILKSSKSAINGTPLPARDVLVTPLGKEKTPVQSAALSAQENLVSAPAAHSPAFEETGKEVGYDQKRWCKQELEEWRNQRYDSNEPSSFHWPSAYEKRSEEMKSSSSREGSEREKETLSLMAKREEKEKMAFLNRRLEERNHRRAERLSNVEDDTLFEQPTRMPNMDFLLEKYPA